MNTYNVNDENFKNSEVYQDFLNQNPSLGSLKIRAYAASQAIPIKGLQVVISAVIGNDKIIFFEGATNESGVIERIFLPAPKLNQNNLESPSKMTYDVLATYTPDNINRLYKVNMFEDICVVQNISIVPNMSVFEGEM